MSKVRRNWVLLPGILIGIALQCVLMAVWEGAFLRGSYLFISIGSGIPAVPAISLAVRFIVWSTLQLSIALGVSYLAKTVSRGSRAVLWGVFIPGLAVTIFDSLWVLWLAPFPLFLQIFYKLTRINPLLW